MKIICMIPARIGSKRIKMKNLRYLGNKPLIYYSIESAKKSNVFDEIYLNSDSEIFEDIALNHGIKFYKRPDKLGDDKTNNDEFLLDFIDNINGDIVIQLLPTSPLILPKEIRDFTLKMLNNNYDTMVSVVNHQIACVYNNKPINFKLLEPHISSQEMRPVSSYATVLMGWKYQTFKESINTFGFAYHGSNTKIGYFTISGLSTIDIDNEEDFELAEAAIKFLNEKNIKLNKPKYYGKKS